MMKFTGFSVFKMLIASLPFLLSATGLKVSAQSMDTAFFTVTPVPSEEGTYSISPPIPDDGQVPAGTLLTVKAKAAEGYALDAIYYTVKGGMWGTTSYESFSSPMEITVDKDMLVGATFVEASLVNDIQVTHDVVFAQPGVKPLKYDVYSPKGGHNLPGIVIIHGGAWASNNEDVMRGLARELIKDGKYVVFSIDYRWLNKMDGDPEPNHMHQLIEDVFGAIAHIQEHAQRYGLDPSRLALTGDSAGGHLAGAGALLSPLIGVGGFGVRQGIYQYLPTYLPAEKSVEQVRKEITQAVKAVAPSYGVYHAKDFAKYLEQKDEAYHQAISPASHIPQVTDRVLPHFIVRGEKDFLITHEMVQFHVELLQAAGQQVEYHQVENVGHAFFDWKPDSQTRATFAQYGVPYAAKMRNFFDRIFYPED